MEPTLNSVGTVVGERRRLPRYYLLTRIDILLAGSGEAYWGSMRNLSRSGVAVTIRQHLQTQQKVTVRFHHQSLDGREVVEDLTAKEIWQCGDNAGLAFDPPLTTGSPALQKARYLVAHLVEKEAGR
jgi:PilZ domain-containing protein